MKKDMTPIIGMGKSFIVTQDTFFFLNLTNLSDDDGIQAGRNVLQKLFEWLFVFHFIYCQLASLTPTVLTLALTLTNH